MPLFRELRIKWSVFHRLLRLVDERLRYGTPGMLQTLRRRRELLLGFSNLLRDRGFVRGRYASEVLSRATLDERALFQRWKQYAQGHAYGRLLAETLCRRRLARLGRIVLVAWRTGMNPTRRVAVTVPAVTVPAERRMKDKIEGGGESGDSEAERSASPGPWGTQHLRATFVEQRANADLESCRKTVVAAWRGALSRAIWLRQLEADRRLKISAKSEPT